MPSVAVVVYPYLYSTALERLLSDRGYDVDAPDVMTEEWEPVRRYDFVLTTFPIEPTGESFHIDLPDDYTKPVRISTAGVAVELTMNPDNPVEGLLELLGRLSAESVDTAADALLAITGQAEGPNR